MIFRARDSSAYNPRVRILVGDRWIDGFLDEHRPAGTVRVRVHALRTLAKLDDLYFVRERSLRTLWNHAREVGPMWVARKVLTRLRESARNEKYASIGVGVILEADAGGTLSPGDAVGFLAPSHPRASERVVLPEALVVPLGVPVPDGNAALRLADALGTLRPALARAVGWSPHAELPPPGASFGADLAEAARDLARSSGGAARELPLPEASPVKERDAAPAGEGSAPSAVLFGFGAYGRTIVMNGVRPHLAIRGVHELDPTLMPPGRAASIGWDTAGVPRPDERYDAYLIAGYHHTHAPLAIEALRRGATAVVEKPLATTPSQLRELLIALDETKGRLIAGFHKRYSVLNDWARDDLAVPSGDPVHYHAVVFEERLPARHWYRWPASRTRIVSNGCHWIDHFLFLNGWSEPAAVEVARGGPSDETANVSIRLDNGAFFSLVLTDVGSGRIGVREHVELRAGDVTVTIDDGGSYRSESSSRILRRRRINRMSSYESMYRAIARRIAAGEPGDPARSVDVSTRLVLAAEDAFTAGSRASRGDGGSR